MARKFIKLIPAVVLLSISPLAIGETVSEREQNVRTLDRTAFCFEKRKTYTQVKGPIQDHPIPSKSKKVRCAIRFSGRDTVPACPKAGEPIEFTSFRFGKDAITTDFVKYKATTQSWVGGKKPPKDGFPLKQLIINVNDRTLRAFICTSKSSKFDVNEMTVGDLADATQGVVRLDVLSPVALAPPVEGAAGTSGAKAGTKAGDGN